jgi:RNA polymerase sigma-70 factor (ECF subfamily)
MRSEREGGGVASGDIPPGLTETFYEELRGAAERLFARERDGHTLQPTAVVNEACLRLMAHGLPDLPREQQLAIAGRVLKQVLVDHARGRDAAKRGGGSVRLGLDEHVLADEATLVEFDSIHRALEKLQTLSERQAEVVTLRIFGGMTMEQVAGALGVSKRTAEGEWAVGRAWLRRELGGALGLTGSGGHR